MIVKTVDASVDPAEVAHFSGMAETWWDVNGPFRPLHILNPARLSWITQQVCSHYDRPPTGIRPLEGLRLLDIGCGGGLLCEPMARLGASVTGIDASDKNIGVARLHAEKSGLNIDYQGITAEALAASGQTFDVVLNMEVIEHVADVSSFLAASAALLAPDGIMILSTLNRTAKSFLFAIVGAEYVLRWLPRGTHTWEKFIKPAEFHDHLAQAGLAAHQTVGLKYHPLNESWSVDERDLSVNYMIMAGHSK